MLGDHCNREETEHPLRDTKTRSDQKTGPANSIGLSKSGSRTSGSPESQKHTNRPGSKPTKGNVEEQQKIGLSQSKHELMDAMEFNKTIAAWFGEKGFIALRSFFRASVLNSLQKDPMCLNQGTCSDSDLMIVLLIADYLVNNGKNFTMSVFSNEVLRPLASSNPTVKRVLQRIGKFEDLGEPTLTREMVLLVLCTLDIPTHSMLGAGIVYKYLEDRTGDLLSVLMDLLRDNASILNVKERAVRDDDVVAAFSEGLQEEMGKLHCWFSNFNNQFVDVSGKLRQLISSQTFEETLQPKKHQHEQGEQELWEQMVRMDEHLKKQQECLMKMRDKERRKLATYAKELEDLHQEMNLKLKSIQDYEKSLKIREKALKGCEALGVTSVEHRDRGDHMADVVSKSGLLVGSVTRDTRHWDKQMAPNEAKWGNDRIVLLHGSDNVESEAKRVDSSFMGQIMEENLELRAILREQNLRIEALTKKAALLTCSARCDRNEPLTSQLSNLACADTPSITLSCGCEHFNSSRLQANLQEGLPQKPQRHKRIYTANSFVSTMSSTLRRARMEIDNLRDEQNTTDLQYERLLHNKLSKRL